MKLITPREIENAFKTLPFETIDAKDLKVGDIARCKSHPSTGVIGEIGNLAYLWHNEVTWAGSSGRLDPKKQTTGMYRYSWAIGFNEKVDVIRNMKPPNKKRYLELIKSNLV